MKLLIKWETLCAQLEKKKEELSKLKEDDTEYENLKAEVDVTDNTIIKYDKKVLVLNADMNMNSDNEDKTDEKIFVTSDTSSSSQLNLISINSHAEDSDTAASLNLINSEDKGTAALPVSVNNRGSDTVASSVSVNSRDSGTAASSVSVNSEGKGIAASLISVNSRGKGTAASLKSIDNDNKKTDVLTQAIYSMTLRQKTDNKTIKWRRVSYRK